MVALPLVFQHRFQYIMYQLYIQPNVRLPLIKIILRDGKICILAQPRKATEVYLLFRSFQSNNSSFL